MGRADRGLLIVTHLCDIYTNHRQGGITSRVLDGCLHIQKLHIEKEIKKEKNSARQQKSARR
jgi:hypothetical protein